MTEPLVQVRNLHKTFLENSVKACDGIDLDLAAGEIVAILGENGAGKTTFVKILAGILESDEGSIELGGKPLAYGTSFLKKGIALVQQHPPYSGELTLWEHALLGHERGYFLPSKASVLSELQALSQRWNLQIPWTKTCNQVSSLVLQKASLLAFLRRDLQVLILDEPTSSLPESEATILLTMTKTLAREQGLAIVLITHKLSETIDFADRILVLRSGKLVAEKRPSETNLRELSSILFPKHPDAPTVHAEPKPEYSDAVVLETRGVGLVLERRILLQDFDICVHRGEILGLAGLRGEGLEALEDVLTAMEEPTTGTLVFCGQDVTGEGIKELRKKGMSYVPSDRMGRGSSPYSAVSSNVIPYRLKELSKKGLLRRNRIRTFFQSLKSRFSLAGHGGQLLTTLSGGNIQKVILARELESSPKVLILAEPTWGLDLSAKEQLFRVLKSAAANGTAIIVLSTEIRDLKELCHRIGVLHQGRLQKIQDANLWSDEEFGRSLLGVAP